MLTIYSSWNINKTAKSKDIFYGATAFKKIYDINTRIKKQENTSLNTEDKKIISKIKKLIISRDYDLINAGIELLRSMDNPVVYEYFLYGNLINQEGYLVTFKLFSGTKPAQPYLDYALISLINYAPNGISIQPSIIKSNIKSLCLIASLSEVKRVPIDYSWEEIVTEDCGIYSTEILPIFEFENLEELSLTNYTELKNLDFLAKCKNLKKLSLKLCNSISNLDALSNCTKLKLIDIENCHNLNNLEGVKKLKTIEIIQH